MSLNNFFILSLSKIIKINNDIILIINKSEFNVFIKIKMNGMITKRFIFGETNLNCFFTSLFPNLITKYEYISADIIFTKAIK